MKSVQSENPKMNDYLTSKIMNILNVLKFLRNLLQTKTRHSMEEMILNQYLLHRIE